MPKGAVISNAGYRGGRIVEGVLSVLPCFVALPNFFCNFMVGCQNFE